MQDIPNPGSRIPIIRAHDAESLCRGQGLAVAAYRSPATAELHLHHLLLLLPSFFFLFFNPDP
jgi:hypothetical protein